MLENLRRMRKRIKQFFTNPFRAKKTSGALAGSNGLLAGGFPRDRMLKIYRIQQENNKKLNDMNEKIAKTIRRIEEVKKRMASAKMNEADNQLRRKIMDDPMNNMRNRPLPKLPFREFKEFVDLHEFIKFNRMSSITEQEIQQCNWDETLRKLCG